MSQIAAPKSRAFGESFCVAEKLRPWQVFFRGATRLARQGLRPS